MKDKFMDQLRAAEAAAIAKLPLAVDLDGTLIHADLFTAALLRFILRTPWRIFELALWFFKGRAFAKAKLAEITPCDPAALPYDDRLLAWLRHERAAGRTLALATASDQEDAKRVAEHLGLFDAVFASNGVINLKSTKKGERLEAEYPGGFVYAGNERADLKVWSKASGAVLVNASAVLVKRSQSMFVIEQFFPRQKR